MENSEDRYQQLISNIPAALYQFELTADGMAKLNYVSPRFSEMFELSAADVIADIAVLFNRVVPADLAEIHRSIELSAKSGENWTWEGRVWMPSIKDVKWMRGESKPKYEPNGSIIWDGILMDITERKNTERKLEFTQFAVDNLADGMTLLKPDGSFAYVNKFMCRFLGYSLDQFLTMHIWDIDDNATPDNWSAHWQQIKTTGGFIVESHHRDRDGKSYPVEISINHFTFDGEEYNFARVKDITAAKAAELALRQSEARYHKLSDNIPGVIFQFRVAADGSTSFPYMSSGSEQLFGIPPSVVMADAECLMKIMHPDDIPEFRQTVAESSHNMTLKSSEVRSILATGVTKWVKSVSRPELQPDGAIIWDGVMLDITTQKVAEDRLRKSQQQIKAFIDNSPAAMYLKDLEGRYQLVNQACVDLGGGNEAALLGLTDYAFYPPEIADQLRANDLEIISSGIARILEEVGTHPDGTAHTYISNKFVLTDEEGNPYALGGVSTDITSLKRAEADLARSQQKHYNLIQSVNGVVWEYDLIVDRFNFVSDRIVALFGYPISDWLEQPDFWQSLIYPADLDFTLATYEDALEHRYNCELEYRMVAADGRVIWIYDISTLLSDLEGNPISTSGLFIDISDLKQVETELQRANERLAITNQELHQATQLKDEFLATMSHELRTPLSAILGIAEALQAEVFGTLNLRQIESISNIEQSGEHLLSLINDILDVSKISAGKLQLNITEISLSTLCQSSLMLVRPQALNKQINIDLQIPIDLETIWVDERRMRQVLINLLNNAVKFTPAGGSVILAIELIPAKIGSLDRENCLCFAVTDTGIGIATKDLTRLFQPFSQVDSNLNRKYGGTGLGLVFVKQIVELHGGSISIESQVDKGSCFTIVLPYHPIGSLEAEIQQPPLEINYFTDEFIATLSHEFRNPLNSILGMSEALLEEVFGIMNERQLNAVTTIDRSGGYLLALINNMVDLSKIQAGKLELTITNVIVAQLCSFSTNFVKHHAIQKQIQLDIDIPTNIGSIFVDVHRMRQVLINLLERAIDCTPLGGTVKLSVTRNLKPSEDDTALIQFSVIDTSKEISPASTEKIYRSLLQSNSSRLGIGLMLVNPIVALHRGKLDFENIIGRGTSVNISLPDLYFSELTTASEDYTNELDNLNTLVQGSSESPLILIVEDNELNINTISSYLTAKGYRPIVATDGKLAIELTEKYHPNLILMDIQMPGMDGIEAIARIRQNPQLVKIPIIALTALAMAGDRERCLAAGATEYLSKPVKLKQLNTTIKQLLDIRL